MPQNRDPGGQFRFWPYSSFLSIYKGSVRLGYDITVPQNRDPGGHVLFDSSAAANRSRRALSILWASFRVNRHSPGHWSYILEGQYIADYSHAKQTNDNLWRNIRSAGMPHWLQPRSIYVVPIPTCTAWRLWCRFQEPTATTILNPQQKSPSLMESAMMICSQPSHNQKL